MEQTLQMMSLGLVLAPLLASVVAGFAGDWIGRRGAHSVTIFCVAISFCLSIYFVNHFVLAAAAPINFTVYHWLVIQSLQLNVGFLLDALSSMMAVVVCFVSLLVHIYSIGYMHDDPAYQRFFSYISLFTFMMLMLVFANNFMQLFFGWEGVGLVSYLLIGFYYQRDSATLGSFKAFMVNRIGDFGFLLGIAAVLASFSSLDYAAVFAKAASLQQQTVTIWYGHEWSLMTVICLLLFIGAMGKSAQVPLHVWLPESMEGPTPISALIHAATMVTAGIYMVSRLSPLYELSNTALNVIMIIGATGALFLGLLGIVQNDVKRVVAYSTLSQLGYMVCGLGASAYAVSMFHLITHACFKALLFLGAGSVIIAMHHDQDIRHMGGLRRYMPVTYWTVLIGSLALAGLPPFSGFFSKDLLIVAVSASGLPATGYATACLTLGVFVTALYTFRAFFLTFHTTPRMDETTRSHLHESPAVVWLPLVILAIPSALLGIVMVSPVLFASQTLFVNTIHVAAHHSAMAELATEYHGAFKLMLHAFVTVPFWLALAGILVAWLCYEKYPASPAWLIKRFNWVYRLLLAKYGFDQFNQTFVVGSTRTLGRFLYQVTDVSLIDGFVNGVAAVTGLVSSVVRRIQTGFIYHYTLAMLLGLAGFLIWLLWG